MMFVDNRHLDVKDKISDENEILNKNPRDSEELNNKDSQPKLVMNKQFSEQRIDTVDADEFGHLCSQFQVLCTNFVFIFVTLAL